MLTSFIAALAALVVAAAPVPAGTTTAPLTVYVATTGNDAYACTQVSKPCLTIQAALDKIPKQPSHPVTVSVGAGTFKGAFVEGFRFNKLAGSLLLKGTYVAAAVATGVASGTFTSTTAGSGLTWATGTMTGAGWTVNDLKGKLVQVTGGSTADSRQVAVISSNTADTITVVGSWPNGNPGNVTFSLVDWGTRINDGVVRPAYVIGGPAGTTTSGFLVSDIVGATSTATSVGIDAFSFDSLTAAGIYVNTDAAVQVRHVKCAATSANSYGIFATGLGSSLVVYSSIINASLTTSTGFFASSSTASLAYSMVTGLGNGFNPGSATTVASTFGCEYTASGSTSQTAINYDSCAPNSSVSTAKISGGWTVGIGARNGNRISVLTTDITGTVAGIYANRGARVDMTTVTGTSNSNAGVQNFGGGTIIFDATTTLSGTIYDIRLSANPTGVTLAQVRALNPKVVRDDYGNTVMGN